MTARRGRVRGSAVLLFACAGLASAAAAPARPAQHQAGAAARPAAAKPFPFDVDWVLQRINDRPVASADPPSLSVDQTLRARGFAGCNSFSMALYPTKDQRLASGAFALTHKTCDAVVMAAERTFLSALHALPRWTVSPDGDFFITAPGVSLRFHRGI